jgi:hypothetical protein
VAELEGLEGLSDAELEERGNALYDVPYPKHMSRMFLLGAVAGRIQDNAFGGLKKTTRHRLEKIAADASVGKPIESRPLPGSSPAPDACANGTALCTRSSSSRAQSSNAASAGPRSRPSPERSQEHGGPGPGSSG